MQDGSDAVSDWPLLNALLNSASGATWVSLHHGGGVGMGFSQHAGWSSSATARRKPRAASSGCYGTTRPPASCAMPTPAMRLRSSAPGRRGSTCRASRGETYNRAYPHGAARRRIHTFWELRFRLSKLLPPPNIHRERSTALFTTTNLPVNALIENIALGKIGLPELQRPFVRPMLRFAICLIPLPRLPCRISFCLGTQVADAGVKGIGVHNDNAIPKLAIGRWSEEIDVALCCHQRCSRCCEPTLHTRVSRSPSNPLTERFDVTDAAIRKDPAYIPDITELWRTGTKLIPFANRFVTELSGTRNSTDQGCREDPLL